MNKIVKDSLTLTIITLIAGLCLGFVYEVTKEPIKNQEELAKQKAYQTVFAEAASFEQEVPEDLAGVEIPAAAGYEAQTVTDVINALDAQGNLIGYVYNIVSGEAYNGDIILTMGISLDGTVTGVEILKISETAGLGMKAKESQFKDQFVGVKTDAFAYTKTGAALDNEIDAISGATVTTNAVTNGVNAGIAFFKNTHMGGN